MMPWRDMSRDAVFGFVAGIVVVGFVVLASLLSGAERRQFMADCTTARGSDDAGLRACASDWPRHQAAEKHGWRVP